MSDYASVMVGLDLGRSVGGRVRLAAALAERFDARLIGIAARQPTVALMGDAPFAAASILEQERRLEAEELERLERLFWEAAGSHNRVALRTATDLPTPCFVAYARAADLLVVGRQGNGDDRDWNFGIDPGDAAMQAGRPILVVPPDVSALAAKRIVVAWRDTREARRAVWDALPFLKAAEAVSIGTVRGEAAQSNVLDVEDYLRQHGVAATVTFEGELREATVADEIIALADRDGADLIVAGAYGHSRTREWAFGGVTRDLLDHAPVCCLMAH